MAITLTVRRAGAIAITAGLLAGGLAGCSSEEDGTRTATDEASASGHAASDTAAAAADLGATWLEGELTDGVFFNEQYQTDDHSTTVEAAYALRAVGGHDDTVATITDALAKAVDPYTSPGKDVYAGATAKLVSLAADTGADPRDFGGTDLVAQLEERTAANGRISDESQYGDYANALGLAWAVRGLTLAGSAEATAARDYLLQQQCPDGYLRQDFSAEDEPCGPKDEPSVDTTALAVVLLHDLAEDDEELAGALDDATTWLVSQQAEDGSFEGGGSLGPNANSTGLAGWALHLAGEDDAAAGAAAWVRAHQVEGCGGALAEEEGAIAYDDAALAAAEQKGITAKTAYQWRLASAQAVPVLLAAPEGAEPAPCSATE